MSKMRFTTIATFVAGTCLLAAGCGGGNTSGGKGGDTGAGGTTGGTAPASGNAGTTGEAGAGGSVGGDGAGGEAGDTGTGGSASGRGGTMGDAGTTGAAGRGGNGAAGMGGRGGTTGTGGRAGTTGAAGMGGRGGTSGAAGRGGTTGAGGTGTQTIFFLDVGGEVQTSPAENPNPRTIVASAGQGPDGIAVDLAAGHIFWTGMGNPSSDDGFIRRSNLDGTNVVTLVPAGGTYTPKQMRVDPPSNKMYWSDREGMRVMRANMDGSNVEVLVTTGTTATDRMDLSRWCVGMAIDTAGGWFYWSQKGGDNAGVGSIRRAHIQMPSGQTSTNRTDIEILFSGLPEPIDLDLDLEAGMIYWADRGDDTISRAPIAIPAGSTAANRKDRQIIVRQVPEAIGVALDKRRGRLYYTGGTGELGRANLDGTSQAEITVSGGAFTGIVVVDLP